MVYVPPNQPGSKVEFKSRYGNFIGGEWKAPVKGQYFEDITPVTGKAFTEIPRSTAEDIELALDAAHAAAAGWGSTSAAERAAVLDKIALIVREVRGAAVLCPRGATRLLASLQNNELLAYVETIDNGKPIRETLNADIPLTADHYRRATSSSRRRSRRPSSRQHMCRAASADPPPRPASAVQLLRGLPARAGGGDDAAGRAHGGAPRLRASATRV
jgi:aldehyde dehydrogenase